MIILSCKSLGLVAKLERLCYDLVMSNLTPAQTPPILSEPIRRQLEKKLREGIEYGFAEVTIVIERGRLSWIRGPAPSEPIAKTN